MIDPASKVKKGWWGTELPGYREFGGTYALFPYEELPPIRANLDDQFDWLRQQPVSAHSLRDGENRARGKPDLSRLRQFAREAGVALPASVLSFLGDAELQARVGTCTNCYLDVGDFPIKALGGMEEFLFHFLSDSQWAGHWYVHVDPRGEHAVFTSIEPFGFQQSEDAGSSGRRAIHIADDEIWYCAASFTEFIYRFWLENEIWFALADGARALSPAEQAYVDWYAEKKE